MNALCDCHSGRVLSAPRVGLLPQAGKRILHAHINIATQQNPDFTPEFSFAGGDGVLLLPAAAASGRSIGAAPARAVSRCDLPPQLRVEHSRGRRGHNGKPYVQLALGHR